MILFLDFDGVLHPFDRAKGTLVLLPHFERVMRDFAAVDIVISSAWRESSTLDELRSFFSTEIRKQIIDVTPVLDYLGHRYVREAEITTWLRDAGREYEPWVAIDDSELFFSPGCANLLLVDADVGFSETTEQTLRHRLFNSNIAKAPG